MLNFKTSLSKGLSLVEVLIATSIILVFFVSLVTVYNTYLKMARSNINTLQAVLLAEEGVEAVKIMRDSSWTTKIATLNNGTNYFLAFNNNTWGSTVTNSYIDGTFERKITLAQVNRDATSQDIVTSGGVNDPNIRLLTVTVSWQNKGATSSKVISTYVTKLFEN